MLENFKFKRKLKILKNEKLVGNIYLYGPFVLEVKKYSNFYCNTSFDVRLFYVQDKKDKKKVYNKINGSLSDNDILGRVSIEITYDFFKDIKNNYFKRECIDFLRLIIDEEINELGYYEWY